MATIRATGNAVSGLWMCRRTDAQSSVPQNAHESKTNRVPVPVRSVARLSESPGTCGPVPAAPPPLAEHGRAAYGRAQLRQGKIHPSDALIRKKWWRGAIFEWRTQAETALVLGITEEAEAKRYIRAFKEIKSILAAMPGGLRRTVIDVDLGIGTL